MYRQFGPSKGNRRPPTRPGYRGHGAPQPQQTASGSVRHYAPSGRPTYVTPPPPPAVSRSTPRSSSPSAPFLNPLAGKYLLHEIVDLLNPGPTAHEIAEAADRLGVKPKGQSDIPGGAIPGGIASVAKLFTQDVGKGASAAAGAVKAVGNLPKQHVSQFQGHKTLGTPTIAQLLAAQSQGNAQVNKGGKVTIPATRHAARDLAAARQLVQRTSRPTFPGLDPEQAHVASQILKTGQQKGATQKELLTALITGLDESTLRNLNYGTGSSQGWRQELVTEYGSHAHNVKASANDFFNETAEKGHGAGMTPGELAQAVQRPANPDPNLYERFRPQAEAILQGYLHGQPSPKAVGALKAAKLEAQNVGIPTKANKPINGDVSPGGPGVVYVRADAKGMTSWAESALGVQEGSAREAKWAAAAGISPSAPWCSAFIAAGLARRGIKPPPDPAYSGSWLNWSGGKHVKNIQNAKPGDLLVFDWGDGGITDHVALYKGNGRMISGNDANNSVGESSVPVSNIVGIVRPKYHGGQVPVRESTPLPGGSAIGVGGAAPSPTGGAPAGTAPAGTAQFASRPFSLGSILTPGAASAVLPEAYERFQLGTEAPEEEGHGAEGIIAQILKRKRL